MSSLSIIPAEENEQKSSFWHEMKSINLEFLSLHVKLSGKVVQTGKCVFKKPTIIPVPMKSSTAGMSHLS